MAGNELSAYGSLAACYDRLMAHVDYAAWADGLETVWKRQGMRPELVLDAGCGSGSVMLELLARGHRVFGVDNASEMLALAAEKVFAAGKTPELFEMDIRALRLPEPCDAVVCLCDTLNYLTKPVDMENTLQSFYRVLKQGGSLIIDLRTPYYYRCVLADRQWVEEEDGLLLYWQNDWRPPFMEMALTFMTEEENGLWRRTDDLHRQRCYGRRELQRMLRAAGFREIEVLEDLKRGRPANAKTERVYFCAKK